VWASSFALRVGGRPEYAGGEGVRTRAYPENAQTQCKPQTNAAMAIPVTRGTAGAPHGRTECALAHVSVASPKALLPPMQQLPVRGYGSPRKSGYDASMPNALAQPVAHRDPTWKAADLREGLYRVSVAPEEHAALAAALAEPVAWHAITRRHVPAAAAPLWQRIRHAITHTAGFCVVSGLPFDGGEDSARRITFLSGYGLGTPVFQDAQGGRLVDIRSTDARAEDAASYKPRSDGTHVRPYETRASFRVHADACDVAGLFCVAAAKEGGGSSVVNARTLHDLLAATRPDVVAVLEQPFYYAKPRRAGEPPSYHGVPVFSWQAGYFKAHIVPDLIFVAQLVPEVPRLTDAQREALLVLLDLASAPGSSPSRSGSRRASSCCSTTAWCGTAAPPTKTRRARCATCSGCGSPHPTAARSPVHAAWFGNCAAGALRGGYLRERLAELA
jgi:hypothetical protein